MNITAKIITTDKLCMGETCITKTELDQLIGNSRIQPPAGGPPTEMDGSVVGEGVDTEPPVITLFGNNPARIPLNSTYVDLGAAVADNVDQNLGHTVTPETIDTSAVGTHTISITATDSAGNAATSTRTVIVYDPAEDVYNDILGDTTSYHR